MTATVTGRPAAAAGPRPGWRPDVQGLRALAVVLVVVHHTGLALPGGFVGVDVFLVVSGYVIAGLLLREQGATGSVRVGRFVARRARRLLPALSLMTVVVLGCSALVLSPAGPLQFAARTAAASQLFVANLYLYRHVGYFDGSATANPFLHTWTLSVEEQFYAVLAVAVAVGVVRRRRPSTSRGPWTRRRVGVVLGAVGSASFLASAALSWGWAPGGVEAPARLAFFAMPTRLWEFAAGAAVAVGAPRLAAALDGDARRTVRTALSVTGMAAIAVAAVALDPTVPYPGAAALLPVLGTVAVLAAGAVPAGSGPVGRLLSWRPAVAVGDLSYAWYLWHWPAIVLVAVQWPGRPVLVVVAAAASLLPAWASTRWLEAPLRAVRDPDPARAAALAGACTLAVGATLVLVGAVGERAWGSPAPDDWWDTPAASQAGCQLWNRDATGDWPAGNCTFGPGDAPPSVLVVGDRLADSVSTGVVDAAAARGARTAVWTRDGCPVTGPLPPRSRRCAEWRDDVAELVRRLEPRVVVVGDGGVEGTPAARREAAARALGDLGATGAAVVVVTPFGDRDRSHLEATSPARPARTPSWRSPGELAAAGAAERTTWAEVLAGGARPDGAGVAVFDPVPVLCAGDRCPDVVDGEWLYTAPDALSRAGGRRLTAALDALLGPLLVPRSGGAAGS